MNCAENVQQNHNSQIASYMDNSYAESSTAPICDNTEDDVDSNYFASDKSEYTSADIGFIIRGPKSSDANSGYSVSGAGDINGDNHSDLIIGAPGMNRQKGAVYVLQSKRPSRVFEVDNLDLPAGNANFKVKNAYGEKRGGRLGHSVSGAGDVNDDKVDDVIVSEPYSTGRIGEGLSVSYVVFGNDKNPHLSTELKINDPHSSFSIKSNKYGFSLVSSVGNFSNTEYGDVIIGTGSRLLVIFGHRHGEFGGRFYTLKDITLNSKFYKDDLVDEDGTVRGVEIYGKFASGAGDIDNNNFDDVIVANGRKAFVVYGPIKRSNKEIKVGELNENQGFEITLDFKSVISAVSDAGDVNGDGFDDVIIGVANADYESGVSYVLYGQEEKRSSPIELRKNSISSDLGFIIQGAAFGDQSGYSLSGAGDVNCDGRDDVIIGAPYTDSNGFEDVLVMWCMVQIIDLAR